MCSSCPASVVKVGEGAALVGTGRNAVATRLTSRLTLGKKETGENMTGNITSKKFISQK